MADEGWWVPDPTGRAELRFRHVDGSWSDQVTNRGVVLIDPWHIATPNRRPVEPWPPGTRYCARCKRGAVAGEDACGRCGWGLTSAEELAAVRRKSNRRAAVIVALAVLPCAALIPLVLLSDGTGTGGGSASAGLACSTFREGLLAAAGGTATNADADATISKAHRHAGNAATLNGEYQHLLVLITSVANGGGDGLAVLAECRRLGL